MYKMRGKNKWFIIIIIIKFDCVSANRAREREGEPEGSKEGETDGERRGERERETFVDRSSQKE
jgi:hypothetical protein